MYRALKPISSELDELYTGVSMEIGFGLLMPVFGVLFLTACDSPALRTLLALSSYNSYYVCSKCNYRFVDPEGKYHSYACFDIDQYPRRTKADAIKWGKAWLRANSQSARDKIKTETGYRYIVF